MPIEYRRLTADRHVEFITPILTAFGQRVNLDRAEATKHLPELTTRIGAFDGEALVGAAGSFDFTMTTPGGFARTAGLTMVAVLPTHRRQGILKALMREHLEGARAEGQPIAALWASEGPIYGRFGYGLASQACHVSIERDRAMFHGEKAPAGRARLLGEAESAALFPAIWDRVRATTPGMPSRSRMWWEVRQLSDRLSVSQDPSPLQRVVIEDEGQPVAYAIYRAGHRFDSYSIPVGALQVVEALGATPRGTRLVWRYLFDLDLMQRIEASLLPVDHPLILLLTEPRRLRLSVSDALWVRLVDVEAALAARAYGGGAPITLEIEDHFCPWNAGRYRLDGQARRAERTADEPDLRLDVAALGSAYLGGISFRQLADAGHVEARSEAALERADSLFRGSRAPWCPEIF